MSSFKERLKSIKKDLTGDTRQRRTAQEELAHTFSDVHRRRQQQEDIQRLLSQQQQQEDIQRLLSQRTPSQMFSDLSIQPSQPSQGASSSTTHPYYMPQLSLQSTQPLSPRDYDSYISTQTLSNIDEHELLEYAEMLERELNEEEAEKAASIEANKKLQSKNLQSSKTDPRQDSDLKKYLEIANIIKFINVKSDKDLLNITNKYEIIWRNIKNPDVVKNITLNLSNNSEFWLQPWERKKLKDFIIKNLRPVLHNTRIRLINKGFKYNALVNAKADKELSINGGRKKTYKRKTQIRRRTRKTTKNLSIRKRKRKTIRKNR